MRHWIFHPLLFYPLVIAFAALAVVASLAPQKWPRQPAPAAATHQGASLVWSGSGFDTPATDPEQTTTVERDLMGHAQTLHIAVLPNLQPPTPSQQGVRILLTQADAAAIQGKPVTVEVSYNPLPINAASGLAVSLRGGGGGEWVSRDAPSPPQGPLKFELPARANAEAIGLRAISSGTNEAYGLEITRITLTPHA